MEQRRVLLIIASVTLVLAAFLGVGIWLFYPGDDAGDQLAVADSGVTGIEWEPIDYLRGGEELPGLEEPEESEPEPDEFEVTYGVADESRQQPPPARQTEQPEQPGVRDNEIVITTVPSAPAEPAPSTAAVIGDKESAPVRGAAQAPTRTPVVGSAERAAAASAAARAAEPPSTASAAVLQDHGYWIQMISSPSRDTVEQAQRTLRSYQLGTTITTKDLENTVYYRLRLGPFAVRDEAEKFLSWVQGIPGFESSMIFLDYRTRVAGAGG